MFQVLLPRDNYPEHMQNYVSMTAAFAGDTPNPVEWRLITTGTVEVDGQDVDLEPSGMVLLKLEEV